MMVRPRLTIIDMLGVALIVLGIMMTVVNFLAARRTIADVESATIHEIAPPAISNKI